jgi:peptidyl-dipeptidase Dcp
MRKLFLLFSSFILIIFLFLTGCKQKEQPMEENPLLVEFKTPFNVPPFEKIKNEHFLPAFQKAIELHKKEIDDILKNVEEPNFQNTIVALEYSGRLLNQISNIFYNLTSANTNPELQSIAKEVSPMLAKHYNDISLNEKLFERVKKVYEQKDKLNLNAEQNKLLEETYKSFVRGGANLPPELRQRFREINEELSKLTLQFGDNVLGETNKFKLVIENKEDLSGLPQNLVDAASETAKKMGMEGKYVFTLHNPSLMPFLTYADNRELREKIWRAYSNRGNNGDSLDNNEIIKKIVKLRNERAKLLGYKSHAHFVLEENMAKNPKNVYDLLNKLWKPALENAKKEAKLLQQMANLEGAKFSIQPWDWRYYAEKVRKAKYDFDEEALKPYLSLDNVRNGIFEVVKKLYGLKFIEIKDIPKYHPEAICYEVKDENDNHIGLLYMDFYPRESKRGGAWMTSYRKQYIDKDGKFVYPVISIVCNFTRPTAETPALLTYDEAETFFHEFGHALHGLLSKGSYPSLTGTSTPRDFVELPSQIMENWLAEEEVLNLFAKHYKTGEAIPKELIEKMKSASKFNQGFATVEYLAASFLDMDYHSLEEVKDFNPVEFEANSMKTIGLISEIIPRYKSQYFQHIFSGGYSAGYYSYIWAEVLDSDAFAAFKEKNSLFDRELAHSFRENILSKGGSEDPMILYKRFRGKEPSIEPLLKKRGLL